MSIVCIFLFILGVVSGSFQPERQFEVKQGSLFNTGRSYTFVIHLHII